MRRFGSGAHAAVAASVCPPALAGSVRVKFTWLRSNPLKESPVLITAWARAQRHESTAWMAISAPASSPGDAMAICGIMMVVLTVGPVISHDGHRATPPVACVNAVRRRASVMRSRPPGGKPGLTRTFSDSPATSWSMGSSTTSA